MRAVLFGLLRHESDVGHGAHRRGVELPVGLTEVDHLLVDPRERRLRVDRLRVLGSAVRAVHLAACADHRGHRGVDDDVAGGVKVRDAACGVDHREFGPVLVTLVQVVDDLFFLRRRQRLDLCVEIRQSVVHVDTELVEQITVLGEGFLVEGANGVAEHDRVADPHHRCLHVQREHDTRLVGVFHLVLVELDQRLLAHVHAVDDVAVEEFDLRLEHNRLAAVGDELHLDLAVALHGHRLLAVVEIALAHVRDVGTRCHRPVTHRMRMLLRVLLDRPGGATIRIALAQNGIDGTTKALGVAVANLLLFLGLRIAGIIGDVVSLALQFLDRCEQLWHRGTDVGELDDVGVGFLGQAPQLSQMIADLLLVGQVVGEFGQDARRNGDVGRLDVDVGGIGERPDDGQKGVGRQHGRLVGQGVDDGRLLVAHNLPSLSSAVARHNGSCVATAGHARVCTSSVNPIPSAKPVPHVLAK